MPGKPSRREATLSAEEQDRLDGSRMSFGDHLEELRATLLRALLGITLGIILCLAGGRTLVDTICRPLLLAQQSNGLQPSIQVLAPAGAFLVYLKMSVLAGLIIAMPWVLYQAWRFVATGLYAHERQFVKMLFPGSLLLFAGGVAFLYFIVLPMILHFFIGFNQSFGSAPWQNTETQQQKFESMGGDSEKSPIGLPEIPVLEKDPQDPPVGAIWIHRPSHRLVSKTADGLWSLALEKGASPSTMKSGFALDQYISFVLMLALAFGVAFETPIVVLFLAWSGIASAATMARGRRYVVLTSVIVGAMLTPPDVLSQLLLAVPIYALFELGIVLARMTEQKRPSGA